MDKNNSNRDVISFFSGAMGLDLGLEQAGLHVKICQDFDVSCVKTIEANGKNAVFLTENHTLENKSMLIDNLPTHFPYQCLPFFYHPLT